MKKLSTSLFKGIFAAMVCLLCASTAAAAAPQVTYSFVRDGGLLSPKLNTMRFDFDTPLASVDYAYEVDGTEVYTGTKTPGYNSDSRMFDIPVSAAQLGTYPAGTPVKLKFKSLKLTDETEIASDVEFSYLLTDKVVVSSFYPTLSYPGNALQELKTTTTLYIYGTMGSKLVSALAEVWQNGVNLGTVDFTPTSKNSFGTTLQIKNDRMPGIIKDLGIVTGNVTFRVVQLTWKDSSNNDAVTEDSNLGEVTLEYKGDPGSVTGDEGLKGGILSWFDPDGTDGILTLYFDKPAADGITAEIEYGTELQHFSKNINNVRLADDRLSVVIDFRGILLSVDAITGGGVSFTDETGNPINPPSIITVNVNNLKTTQGSPINVTYQFGDRTYIGSYWTKTYAYKDLTLPNPVIEDARFFTAPYTTALTDVLSPDHTHIYLDVANLSTLASANVSFFYKDREDEAVTVPATFISDNAVTAPLPDVVKANGTGGLFVGLTDLVITEFDGSNHVVKPYNFDKKNLVYEVASIAELVAFEPGFKIRLNMSGETRVTMKNANYIFIEDTTGGLLLDVDNDLPFAQGTALAGYIEGEYLGDHFFIPLQGEFEAESADISTGILLDVLPSEAEMETTYNCRLLSFNQGDGIDLSFDRDVMTLYVNYLEVVTSLVSGFKCPDPLMSVTGILYKNQGQWMILPRTKADISSEKIADPEEPVLVEYTLAEAKAYTGTDPIVVRLDGAVVTHHDNEAAYCYLEDATAAVMLVGDDAAPFARGTHLSGTMNVAAYGQGVFQLLDHSLEAIEGEELTATDLNVAEAYQPANFHRVVRFRHNDDEPIVYDRDMEMIIIANSIFVFGDEAFASIDFSKVKGIYSVTGILNPMMIGALDVLEPEAVQLSLIPRDAADLSYEETGICNPALIGADTFNAYDLRGARVPASSLRDLTPGLYIVNGVKVLVK